jgi:methionyl-tRNA formyltransferase
MSEGLRIVCLCAVFPAYQRVADWAERRGHDITLVVTPPESQRAAYGDAPRLSSLVPDSQDVLITSKLRTVAAPALAALKPDLAVVTSFPRRVPAEIIEIPRYGAVNLHPAALPRGRGMNPLRLIYEGDDVAGATLHRVVHEFDAGPILSRRTRPLPTELSGRAILDIWSRLLTEVLDEGAERAANGDPGIPQDDAQATYPAPFTAEERRLDWTESARTVQRRAAALNVRRPTARARIGDEELPVYEVQCLTSTVPAGEPGTVVERADDGVVVRVGDGAVRVTTRPSVT